MIDYPRLFSMVYMSPIAVEKTAFMGIHNAIKAYTNNPHQPQARMRSSPPAKVAMDRVTELYREREGDPLFTRHGHTAIIPITGPIVRHAPSDEMCFSGTFVTKLQTALREAATDPTISNILLDIDSPGGTVTGIPEAAALIAQIAQEKQVIAFTDSDTCSAAYWLASQATAFFCTQSATIGSIGVYIAWLDESLALEKEGYRLELFKAGDHKGMGLPGNPLSAADRKLLQDSVLEIYGQFKSAVTTARKNSEIADSTMQGQTFHGDAAHKLGLVDAIVPDFGWVLNALNQ
jgi:protease-4